MIRKLPVGKDAAGGDKAVDCVTDGSDQNPELVTIVERLLFDAEYHRPQILIVRKVIPVLRAVEVFLVGLLLDGGELETLILLPLLLDGGLLTRRIVRVTLILRFEQAGALLLPLQHRRTLLRRALSLHLFGIGSLVFALTFVPDRVRRDLLPRAFDPVAGRWYQIMRELLTELVYEAKFILSTRVYSQFARCEFYFLE